MVSLIKATIACNIRCNGTCKRQKMFKSCLKTCSKLKLILFIKESLKKTYLILNEQGLK